MWGIGLLASAALGGLAMAMMEPAAADRGGGADGLRKDLSLVSKRTIFFGHQSVGGNILAGVQRLAARGGVPLRVVEPAWPVAFSPGTIAHALVEVNGEPERKLKSFAALLASGPASGPDVALVKFCYVDFGPDTDAAKLFARYREAMADLQARYPGTLFVHVTAPLTTVQGGAKALAKRLLGKAPAGYRENLRREEFNALLRDAYRGKEPLFDLAAVESTRPDGSSERAEWNGRAIPALFDGYTGDGGHLNESGQDRAARELIAVIARLPGRAGGDPSAKQP